MPKRKPRFLAAKPVQGSTRPGSRKRFLALGLPCVLLLTVGVLAYLISFPPRVPTAPKAMAKPAFPKVEREARTLDDLLAMPLDHLATADLAEMNLLCALGLPGAEKLDIDYALATLDRWAARAASETNRHLYRAHDPQWAETYRHSEAYLRASLLVQVLYEDLGVKYDLAAKDNFSFRDSRVAFIHGMIPAPSQTLTDTPGGTCASMPVLVAAIGRRLDYPLKLVTTKGHVFVRWDGKSHSNPAWRERFNMEATNGFTSYEDDHYKSWPFKLTESEVRANHFLVSLTPAEVFAQFLAARGHCGVDNGQMAFAARCYENAYRYDATRPEYLGWFVAAAKESGYKPVTPVLAQALARRVAPPVARRPGLDPLAMPKPSEIAAVAATMEVPGVSGGRLGWAPPSFDAFAWPAQPPQGRMPTGAPQPLPGTRSPARQTK